MFEEIIAFFSQICLLHSCIVLISVVSFSTLSALPLIRERAPQTNRKLRQHFSTSENWEFSFLLQCKSKLCFMTRHHLSNFLGAPWTLMPLVWSDCHLADTKSRVPQCSSARMSVTRRLLTPQCSASRQRTFQSRTPLASCLHASAGALSITEPRRMWRLMHLESFFLVFLYLASLEMEKLDVIA